MAVLVAMAVCPAAYAAGPKTVYVQGYVKKDGTYVAPHMRSAPGGGSVSPGYTPIVPSLPPAVRTEARPTARVEPRTEARASLTPPAAPALTRADFVGRWRSVSKTVSVVSPPSLPAAFGVAVFESADVVLDGATRWSLAVEGAENPAQLLFSDPKGVVVSRSLGRMKNGQFQLAFGPAHSFPRDVAIGQGNALAVISFERVE